MRKVCHGFTVGRRSNDGPKLENQMDASGNFARYDAVARALHWAIAVLILVNLPLGLLHDALKPVNVMPMHKSLGLTVLVLSVVRIVWRLLHPAPPLPGRLSMAQRSAATTVQGLLYILMLALPLSGWIFTSAGKYPLRIFNLFNWPKLALEKGSALEHLAHSGHAFGSWAMLILVVGHAGAALWHQFCLRDGIFRRML